MRIVAFDLGTALGVAGAATGDGPAQLLYFELLRPWGKPGTKDFVTSHARWALARATFRQRLAPLAAAAGDAVYFELPMGTKKNRDAERVLTGLELALGEAAEAAKLPTRGVPQPTLKKWSSGSGLAKKDDMVVAARRLWALGDAAPLDDNVADALCLLAFAFTERGVSVPGAILGPTPAPGVAKRKKSTGRRGRAA